jgi:hypothetical protein
MTVLRCPRCGKTRFRRDSYFLVERTVDVACNPTTGLVSAESSDKWPIDPFCSLPWACVAKRHEISDPDLIDELDRKTKYLTEARSS